jgi:hypothetical protein
MWRSTVSNDILAAILGFAIILTVMPRLAEAQDVDELVEQASAHFRAGEYVEAAELFGQAYELDPHPVLLYNRGRCFEQLGDPIRALELYHEALSIDPDEQTAGAIRTKIDEVEGYLIEHGVHLDGLPDETFLQLAKVSITSLPDGANVSIDGESFGACPIDELYMAPGQYRLEVSMEGYSTHQRRLDIEAGRNVTVHAGLRRSEDVNAYIPPDPGQLEVSGPRPGMMVYLDGELLGETPLAPTAVSPGSYSLSVQHPNYQPWTTTVQIQSGVTSTIVAESSQIAGFESEQQGWTTRDWGFVTLGGAGVFLVTGVVFGVLAQADADHYHTNTDSPLRSDVRDSAQTEAVVADLFYGCTLAAAAAAAVLIFLVEPETEQERWESESTDRVDVRVAPIADGWSLSLIGAF